MVRRLKEEVKAGIKAVADGLGNTKAISRSSGRTIYSPATSNPGSTIASSPLSTILSFSKRWIQYIGAEDTGINLASAYINRTTWGILRAPVSRPATLGSLQDASLTYLSGDNVDVPSLDSVGRLQLRLLNFGWRLAGAWDVVGLVGSLRNEGAISANGDGGKGVWGMSGD